MAIQLDPVPQIWGITGNLGGGKTLSAVYLAALAMSRGYYVCTNITLKLDELAAEYGRNVYHLYSKFSFDSPDFDPFRLPTGSPRGTRNPKRVLVIMDECAEWISQYTQVNKDPRIERFNSWLRHSSKRNQDVVLIVQRLDYLNKNIRILISKWLIVDDLKVWRIPVLKWRLPFMGNFVMQRVFNSLKKLLRGPCLVHKPSIGRFYDTAECLNADGAQYNTEYVVPQYRNLKFDILFFWWVGSVLLLLAVIGFRSLGQDNLVYNMLNGTSNGNYTNTAR